MKKVINGKLYDTGTAEELCEYHNHPYVSNFDWYEERLYRKKTGEFFLYGKGNAASKYAKHITRTEREPGEKITPLPFEEAEKWVEEHLDGDEYIELFGEPEESDEKERLNLYVNRQTVTKLKQKASREGKSLSALVEELLDAGLS